MRSNRAPSTGFRRTFFVLIFCFVVFIILLYEYFILTKIVQTHIETAKPSGEPTKVIPQKPNEIKPVTTPTKSPTSRFRTLPPTAQLPAKQPPKTVFPDTISFEYNLDNEPAVLIVGGTDGSGTRSVVQTLTDLGVTMVSEDPETFDIHADLVGGWPPIVKPVLRDVTTLQYSFHTLSPNTQNFMKRSLQMLLDRVKEDSVKPTSYRLAVGGVLPKPNGISASKVLYGFKAPVAMTLLPLWAQFLPRCIFIHVVRDGRDIAFSVNQGPVDKFFSDFYKTNYQQLSGPIKAIRLWSDWNSDIYEFSKTYQQQLISFQDKSKSFGYHVMHTEDLVNDENLNIKFNSIYHLAKFVGSSLSDEQLCCLAKKSAHFMGSHDRTPIEKLHNNPEQQKQVTSRYGKWKRKVGNNHQLLAELLSHGKKGLKFFGYEPVRNLPDANLQYQTKDTGFECSLTNEQCKQYYPEVFADQPPDPLSGDISVYFAGGLCKGTKGVDFKGGKNNIYDEILNFCLIYYLVVV